MQKIKEARYKVITNALVDQINLGHFKPGDRIPSISSLCASYSVSKITALRVFKELTNSDFIYKKEGSGYFVNGGSANVDQQTFLGAIGNLLRPLRPWQADDNYFNEINCAVQNEAGRRRLNLIWSHTCNPLNEHYKYPLLLQHEIKRAACDMADKVDGFLLDERISDKIISELQRKIKKPMILVNRKSELAIDTVSCNNHGGAVKMAETAIKFGYDYFIICNSGGISIKKRCEYFRQELLDNKIAESHITEITDWSINPHEASMNSLFEKIKIGQKMHGRIFIFCDSDSFARNVCRELKIQKMEPGKDIGLAGFGGMDCSTAELPEIATVNIKSSEMGTLAVDKLLYKIAMPLAENRDYTPDFELRLGNTI
jgi:DNA-binding LacI/PurR family transcriptional regulator